MFNKLFLDMVSWGFDKDGALERFLGDEELYVSCLNSFVKDLEISDLEEAISKKEYKKVFEISHSIKGVSGNLGLNPIFSSSSDIVELVRKPPYPENLDFLLFQKLQMLKINVSSLVQIIKSNNPA